MKKIVVLLLLLTSVLSCDACGARESSTARIERITGFDLPDDMKEVYYFQDETFTGCAGQYSVYEVEQEPACIGAHRLTVISENDIASIQNNLESHGIPAEHRPQFDRAYTYTTGAEDTFLIYFPEEGLLKVWMRGH